MAVDEGIASPGMLAKLRAVVQARKIQQQIKVSGLAKSVYYYTLSKIDKDNKNKVIIDKYKNIVELMTILY